MMASSSPGSYNDGTLSTYEKPSSPPSDPCTTEKISTKRSRPAASQGSYERSFPDGVVRKPRGKSCYPPASYQYVSASDDPTLDMVRVGGQEYANKWHYQYDCIDYFGYDFRRKIPKVLSLEFENLREIRCGKKQTDIPFDSHRRTLVYANSRIDSVEKNLCIFNKLQRPEPDDDSSLSPVVNERKRPHENICPSNDRFSLPSEFASSPMESKRVCRKPSVPMNIRSVSIPSPPPLVPPLTAATDHFLLSSSSSSVKIARIPLSMENWTKKDSNRRFSEIRNRQLARVTPESPATVPTPIDSDADDTSPLDARDAELFAAVKISGYCGVEEFSFIRTCVPRSKKKWNLLGTIEEYGTLFEKRVLVEPTPGLECFVPASDDSDGSLSDNEEEARRNGVAAGCCLGKQDDNSSENEIDEDIDQDEGICYQVIYPDIVSGDQYCYDHFRQFSYDTLKIFVDFCVKDVKDFSTIRERELAHYCPVFFWNLTLSPAATVRKALIELLPPDYSLEDLDKKHTSRRSRKVASYFKPTFSEETPRKDPEVSRAPEGGGQIKNKNKRTDKPTSGKNKPPALRRRIVSPEEKLQLVGKVGHAVQFACDQRTIVYYQCKRRDFCGAEYFYHTISPQSRKMLQMMLPGEQVKFFQDVLRKQPILTNGPNDVRGPTKRARRRIIPDKPKTLYEEFLDSDGFPTRSFVGLRTEQKRILCDLCCTHDYTAPLRVGMDPEGFKGRCVFAAALIRREDFICEYRGQYFHSVKKAKKVEEKHEAQKDGSFMYFFPHPANGRTVSIDGAAESQQLGPGRLINHSKKRANVYTYALKSLREDCPPKLVFLAKRDIKEGEELLVDYGEKDKEVLKQNPWLNE